MQPLVYIRMWWAAVVKSEWELVLASSHTDLTTTHWRLNVFRAAYRSSSGALTVFAASGLHRHVVTARSQFWVGTVVGQFPLRLDNGRSPHAYVNQRLQIQLELLMMSGLPLETYWALNERWNNKFYYKVKSCWLFLLSYTTMHGTILK